jgi:type I restriction enzyme M protein
MPIKKSELYSSLWKGCDELRGGMDASQYKDYVLVLLFVKYVSDKYAGRKDADLEVPAGGSFGDMVAAKGKADIGERLNKIIAKLAEKNQLEGLITLADFDDGTKLGPGKEKVERLSNLVAIFENPALDFRRNRADGDDLLGDAYEYLMRHFATESGKSKGQFYTPAEVSRVMAKVIGVGEAKSGKQTIHDPTCGSGSLLLRAHAEALARAHCDLTLYGQEMDNATRVLAQMNMYLHGCTTAEIKQGNTLASPQHLDEKTGRLKTFDFVVANPPFSSKAWSTGVSTADDPFGRFGFGIPPAKNGDYAFLLHVLATLKSTGKGAIILPHGVLFRGNAEAQIRKEIVTRGYIQAIIGLPPNLFYGTGIPACIVVLDKEKAAGRAGIFMIDASRGFLKDGNKNRLRERDIHLIVDAFARRLELPRFSRMVPLSEIEQNEYNLNLPRYIDSSEPEDLHDIEAHLKGGIPDRDLDALGEYWKVFPGVRAALFEADRPGYSRLRVPAGEIKDVIFGHEEFAAFQKKVEVIFAKWKKAVTPELEGLGIDASPKALIESLSESILEAFHKAKLIDPYAVYQHLMDYWAESMQDDVYMIANDGWTTAAQPRVIVEDKDKKGPKEKPDLVVDKVKYRIELIPPALVIARYFEDKLKEIEALEATVASVEQKLDEMREEHGGEEGLLAGMIDDKENVIRKAVNERLKAIKADRDAVEERSVLQEYLTLLDQDAVAKRGFRAPTDIVSG